MRYTHIFDYFDENGKYIGGCEPITESTERPTNISHGVYSTPTYVVYVGWCYEDDKVYSGCYFPDAVEYNTETKQLTSLYEENETVFGKVHKFSKYMPSDMTYEFCCQILKRPLCKSYVRRKKQREDEILEEYKKCMNDFEYFKKNYVRLKKKI